MENIYGTFINFFRYIRVTSFVICTDDNRTKNFKYCISCNIEKKFTTSWKDNNLWFCDNCNKLWHETWKKCSKNKILITEFESIINDHMKYARTPNAVIAIPD